MTTKTVETTATLTTPTFDFLRDLAQHNNREWFQANRKRYEAAKAEVERFVGRVLVGVNAFEPLPNTEIKDCIFRINRDVRFSNDKSPYKRNFAAAIGAGGRHSGRIDYYIHIQPGDDENPAQTFIGGGMWQPTPAHLAKFRQEIDYNAAELKGIIEDETFRGYFPEIWGETMKTAPKGYTVDHPDIALLRRKQLFFMHRYTDNEVVSPDFVDNVVNGCRLLKPYCDFLNYLFFEEE